MAGGNGHSTSNNRYGKEKNQSKKKKTHEAGQRGLGKPLFRAFWGQSRKSARKKSGETDSDDGHSRLADKRIEEGEGVLEKQENPRTKATKFGFKKNSSEGRGKTSEGKGSFRDQGEKKGR